MQRPQGKESAKEIREANGCVGQVKFPSVLKLHLVLTHTVRGDEAGWGRTGVSALCCSLWFHFSWFSYSQSTTVWKCYKECSRHNNSYIFILFHFSFLRQILTVAQASFKLLPQPPSPGTTGVCHHIWPIHKFVILYYNTLLLIVFYCYSLTV